MYNWSMDIRWNRADVCGLYPQNSLHFPRPHSTWHHIIITTLNVKPAPHYSDAGKRLQRKFGTLQIMGKSTISGSILLQNHCKLIIQIFQGQCAFELLCKDTLHTLISNKRKLLKDISVTWTGNKKAYLPGEDISAAIVMWWAPFLWFGEWKQAGTVQRENHPDML